jgi:5'-nucleotidase
VPQRPLGLQREARRVAVSTLRHVLNAAILPGWGNGQGMKAAAAGIALIACLAVGLPMAHARVESRDASNAVVSVQLLAINDFHGAVEPPPKRLFGQPAGGGEYLATQLAALKAQNPNTIIIGSGDMVGNSPPLSARFHDEPAIEVLNEAGLQVTSVGNHEFDEGKEELLRKQRGGCHPRDGCQDGDPYTGAKFTYLAANVEVKLTAAQLAAHERALSAFKKARAAFRAARTAYRKQMRAKRLACRKDPRSATCRRKVTPPSPFTRKRPTKPTPRPVLPPTKVMSVGGVKIGFIGVTVGGTPEVPGLRFSDEVAAVNQYAALLKRQGVNTIVALVHRGGTQTGGLNDCTGLSGSIVDVVKRFSRNVDVVHSAHSHRYYVCTLAGKLLTTASSEGRAVTDIDLSIDRSSGKVVAKRAVNTIVTQTIGKDPEVTAIVEKWRRLFTG